jgi:hypothetical protein
MRTAFVLVCLCVLTGCGTVIPSQLEPPAKALMVPPAKLPDIKTGDDLVQKHADLRRLYATETDKQRRLQKYVRTLIGKQ